MRVFDLLFLAFTESENKEFDYSDFIFTYCSLLEDSNGKTTILAPPRSGKSWALAAFIAIKVSEGHEIIYASWHTKIVKATFARIMTCLKILGVVPTTANQSEILTANGGKIAGLSLNSDARGLGADYLIIDDPNSTLSIESGAERNRVYSRFKGLLTRLNDKTSQVILCTQRMDKRDLWGLIQEYDYNQWSIYTFPLIMNVSNELSHYDLRQNEVILSDRYDPKIVHIEEFEIQYQQNTNAQKSNSFTPNFGEYNEKDGKKPLITLIVIDPAIDGTKNSDLNAVLILGLYQNEIRILDGWHMRANVHELVQVIKTFKTKYPDAEIICESNGGGHTLKTLLPLKIVTHKNESKSSRFWKYSVSAIESGIVKIPKVQKSWTMELMRQIYKFGDTSRDDYVDSLTYGLREFRYYIEKMIKA